MAVYVFKAKNVSGKIMQGSVQAANEAEARVRLRAEQLVPIVVKLKSDKVAVGASAASGKRHGGKLNKVKPKELQIFTRQFAVLISSGVPILQSMESMASGSKSPGMISTLNDIVLQLNKGKRLYEAMAGHPLIFDRMYVNLVRAGEEGGVLEEILKRLATHIEKSIKLRGKIKGAMVYPAAIIMVAFLVITAIMIFVIPSFVEMFEQNKVELPGLTVMVINLSNLFTEYWYIVIGGFVGSIALIKSYYATTGGREVLDKYMLAVPVLGDVLLKGAVAAFSRTMATMLKAGVRIGECLEIASTTVGNVVIERSILKSRDSIEKGRTLAEPFQKDKYMPLMVSQMIAIGEQTGSLDNMLEKIADFYEDEVETAAAALTSLMEPILMVVLGGIIAVLVVAMYLPIFKMADAVL